MSSVVLKNLMNINNVVHTAMVSAVGSATKTAAALFSRKCGRIKISGNSNITFLNKARKIEKISMIL